MEEAGAEVYFFENTEGGHTGSYTPEQRAKSTAMTLSFFRDQFEN